MLTGLSLAPAWLDIQPFPFLVPCGGVSMSFERTCARCQERRSLPGPQHCGRIASWSRESSCERQTPPATREDREPKATPEICP